MIENDHFSRWTTRTAEAVRERIASLPRVKIAIQPTPLERLDRLSTRLGGPSIWMKRDDCTGLAGGGNKARKLEFLVGAARAAQADTLITAGAVQSNHARQVAAAAAKFGFECHLILTNSVAENSVAYRENGNYLISELLGAHIHHVGDVESAPVMQRLSEELAAKGKRPFVIPVGGSNAVGTYAYVEAFFELQTQSTQLDLRIDRIVLPTGSGGTQAGLAIGAHLAEWTGKLTGISVGAERARQQQRVERVIGETLQALKLEALKLQALKLEALDDSRLSHRMPAVHVDDRFVGPGYGRPADETIEAIRLVAETEGVLLDPVYSGKAMAGVIESIRSGKIQPGENVVFWHTGGSTALSAYPGHLKRGGNHDCNYGQ